MRAAFGGYPKCEISSSSVAIKLLVMCRLEFTTTRLPSSIQNGFWENFQFSKNPAISETVLLSLGLCDLLVNLFCYGLNLSPGTDRIFHPASRSLRVYSQGRSHETAQPILEKLFNYICAKSNISIFCFRFMESTSSSSRGWIKRFLELAYIFMASPLK